MAPDGTDFQNKIVYKEVLKPERIVYMHGSDIENDPNQFHVTVTFEVHEGKTKLTMRSLFATAADRDKVVNEYGAIEGGIQTLNRLEQYSRRITSNEFRIKKFRKTIQVKKIARGKMSESTY